MAFGYNATAQRTCPGIHKVEIVSIEYVPVPADKPTNNAAVTVRAIVVENNQFGAIAGEELTGRASFSPKTVVMEGGINPFAFLMGIFVGLGYSEDEVAAIISKHVSEEDPISGNHKNLCEELNNLLIERKSKLDNANYCMIKAVRTWGNTAQTANNSYVQISNNLPNTERIGETNGSKKLRFDKSKDDPQTNPKISSATTQTYQAPTGNGDGGHQWG